MDAFEKYFVLKDKISIVAKCMGLNVFEFDYKTGILTYFTIAVQFFAKVSSTHTVIDSFPDIISIMKALTTYGVVIQVIYI